MNSTKVEALRAFEALPKFRCTEPQFQLLNPSPIEVSQPVERAINACAAQLVALIESGAPEGALIKAIETSVRSVERPFDTEDREYLAYYYSELGRLAGVRVGPFLNGWLYGFPLALLLRLFRRG